MSWWSRTAINGFPRALRATGLSERIGVTRGLGTGWLKTVHYRPEEPTVTTPRVTHSDHSHTCIVIQGPLITHRNYTLNSVRYYRELFPGVGLIVSTWDDEDVSQLRALESSGAHVLAGPKPGCPGPANINLQLTSTLRGLEAARDGGWKWSVRSRSDQRIHSRESLALLYGLWTTHPLPDPYAGSRISGRIVVGSLDSFRYRMYGVSDQFHFGDTNDLVTYWEMPHDERTLSQSTAPGGTLREFALQRFAEVGLCSTFLSKVGWEPKWSLLDYWLAVRALFVIVDTSSLDLQWPKYTNREYRWRRYAVHSPLEELTFALWMSLVTTSEDQIRTDLEYLLDLRDWAPPAR